MAFQPDAETMLYEGFTSDRDRQFLPGIRQAAGAELTAARWPLEDQRLADMLKRYRARNYPDSLDAAERAEWRAYCRGRLTGTDGHTAMTLETFMQELQQLQQQADDRQRQLLAKWQQYAMDLAAELSITGA